MACSPPGDAGSPATLDPSEADSAASIHWPSRDTRAVPALHHHGMCRSRSWPPDAPDPAGRCPPPPGAGPGRPPGGAGDLDAIAGLDLSLLRYEADLGTAYFATGAGEWIRTRPRRCRRFTRPWAWVAEEGGSLVGVVALQPPEASGWMEPFTGPALGVPQHLSSDPARARRRTRLALVDAAHRELDAAGVAVTLLPLRAGQSGVRTVLAPPGVSFHLDNVQARPAAALR